MEKTWLVENSHPPSREGKKTLTPTGLRACSNCPRLGYASPLPIRIGFDLDGRTGMSPSISQNYFPQDHWSVSCLKHDNQTRGGFGLIRATRMYLPLGKWFFPNFKQDFLLNGKRVKCLRRNLGPARRLALPLQKGDWTRWVTLLAEPIQLFVI